MPSKTTKYVILRDRTRAAARRSPMAGRRTIQPGTFGLAAEAPEPSVEVAELSNRDIADVARDPSVVQAAPAIKMKLVKPTAMQEVKPEMKVENVAWGVTAVGAHQSPFSGAGVKVGILDTGIDANHSAFAGMNLTQRDFTGEGNGDGQGHGTHCAGTIFGRDVNGTRIGVARGVTDAFIGKVLDSNGSGDTAGIMRGLTDAMDEGCQVISMSIGFDFAGWVKALIEQNFTAELAAGIALSHFRANLLLFDALGAQLEARLRLDPHREILLIAAAGNESNRGGNPAYELPVAAPADATGFVSVGAVERSGMNVSVPVFSNTGCDLCGPGVGVVSAKKGSANGLIAMSGTSMATPHVAGCAALWLEQINQIPVPPNTFPAAPRALPRLIGQSILSAFAPGFDPFDVGSGLVRAPGV